MTSLCTLGIVYFSFLPVSPASCPLFFFYLSSHSWTLSLTSSLTMLYLCWKFGPLQLQSLYMACSSVRAVLSPLYLAICFLGPLKCHFKCMPYAKWENFHSLLWLPQVFFLSFLRISSRFEYKDLYRTPWLWILNT